MMRRRGNAALEFALAAAIVVVLLGGVIEWGWLLSREVAVVQVARDAAQTASRTRLVDDPEVVAERRAEQALVELGVPMGSAEVTTTFETGDGGEVIRVRVEVPYEGIVSLVPTPSMLVAETAMRLEDQ